MQNHDFSFVQKPYTTSQLGLSGLQKCTTTMRILAYDIAFDATDEYVQYGSSTSMLAPGRALAEIY